MTDPLSVAHVGHGTTTTTKRRRQRGRESHSAVGLIISGKTFLRAIKSSQSNRLEQISFWVLALGGWSKGKCFGIKLHLRTTFDALCGYPSAKLRVYSVTKRKQKRDQNETRP